MVGSKRAYWKRKAGEIRKRHHLNRAMRIAGFRPRSPWTVAVLEFLPGLIGVLGLGHIHNRRRKRGVFLFIVWALAWWGGLFVVPLVSPLLLQPVLSAIVAAPSPIVALAPVLGFFLAVPAASALWTAHDTRTDKKRLLEAVYGQKKEAG